jgi:aconitate hydratase
MIKGMARSSFANVRLRNLMIAGEEGSATLHQPGGQRMSLFEAAMKYAAESVPIIVFAGNEYGNGCSCDRAAKEPKRLGVRAVIARSFERIHRVAISNQWLAALDERGVTFRLTALDAQEFMRRFLLHALPPSTHRIREYGMLDNTARRANIARASISCVTCPRPARSSTTLVPLFTVPSSGSTAVH